MDLHMLAGQFGHRNSEEFLHSGQCLHKSTKEKKKNAMSDLGASQRLRMPIVYDHYIFVADHILVIEDHVARFSEVAQASSHGMFSVSDAWDQS